MFCISPYVFMKIKLKTSSVRILAKDEKKSKQKHKTII